MHVSTYRRCRSTNRHVPTRCNILSKPRYDYSEQDLRGSSHLAVVDVTVVAAEVRERV